jgi:hypothetical protein
MTTHPPLHLAPRDLHDIQSVANDRFQGPRARRRSQAMLLLNQNADPKSVHLSTGLTPAQQQRMLERLSAHGVQAAIFGSPHRPEVKRYDSRQIATFAAECLKRRPPPGCLRWNLVCLVDEVRHSIPGAENLSKESLRQIIKRELKILSIRMIDPYWMQQTRRQAVA